MAQLVRSGLLIAEADQTFLADPTDSDTLSCLQAASVTYGIAFGTRKDHKVLTIQQGLAAQAPTPKNRRVGAHGFSLHADVRCGVNARYKLEPLCRYVARPALANSAWPLTTRAMSSCN